MNKSVSSIEAELRISHELVIAILIVAGLTLVFVSSAESDLSERLLIALFALLFYALSGTTWLLNSWKPWLGRWFTAMTLILIVYLGNNWLRVPGFLTLLVIPTTLAAAMIGLPAATAIAVGETALLLLLPEYTAAGVNPATIVAALIAIWAMLGMIYLMYQPMYQVTRWSWMHFQQAQSSLEEARGHKAKLEQALDDLAHANRQLALVNERLAGLRLIAEEAQRTKAAFVAKVSHELRTPLNMIIGLVGLMMEAPEIYGRELPLPVLEDLKIVHRNCEHLSSMINDVLDLSQAEAGRLALHKERVDLSEIVGEAVEVVRPLLEKKGLGLQVTIPDDLPEVYCDQTRIRQVVLNLMSNAARFTEEGGITIRIAEQGENVIISVTDTGPGISPEDAESIFEPFCQGAGELWRDKGGSGLGLSISKQFIELHGGRIWLESKPGAGTTFSFDLPISAPIAPVARPGHWIKEEWIWAERTSRAALPTDGNPRIVICDETGDLYSAFARYSDKVEFVDTRNLAQIAQELQRCPAHAVVLNTASPDNLWPLVERARLQVSNTPVIGYSVPPRIEHALKSGAVGYLIKPVTRINLEEALQAVDRPLKRILVVDDDPDVLPLLTRMLHACDSALEITTASNGEQALVALHSGSPDLVLLDLVMPDMDGWKVLELKRQDEAIRDIPVILVSAQDPTDRPAESKILLVTMNEGLSLSKLLRCSLSLSALLLAPD